MVTGSACAACANERSGCAPTCASIRQPGEALFSGSSYRWVVNPLVSSGYAPVFENVDEAFYRALKALRPRRLEGKNQGWESSNGRAPSHHPRRGDSLLFRVDAHVVDGLPL